MITTLLRRGHAVRVLVWQASLARVPPGAAAVAGDALNPETFVSALNHRTTLVHLVGTPHPSPSKASEFERVDWTSIQASVEAGRRAPIAHLVYVSVAQPAPMMHAYVGVRARGEAAIAAAGLAATMIRPWYVLGPDHWWPLALKPFHWLAEQFPPTREAACHMGLVTLPQMVAALVHAVESPPVRGTIRVVDVSAIRAAQLC